jgi:Leucine-rich repeat (LRR) protein
VSVNQVAGSTFYATFQSLRVCLCLASMCLPIVMTCGCAGSATNSGEAAAVAAIVKLGGKVEYNENSPDRPVAKVYLHGTAVQDSDLAALEKLPRLQNLFLGRTKISNAGLEHLQQANHLQTLSLNSTQVTDDGVRTLARLKNLRTLNLQDTKVTEACASELQAALPGLKVAR